MPVTVFRPSPLPPRWTPHALFPLWRRAEDSPDFSLPTYLYWRYLHSNATISVNLTPLVPRAFWTPAAAFTSTASLPTAKKAAAGPQDARKPLPPPAAALLLTITPKEIDEASGVECEAPPPSGVPVGDPHAFSVYRFLRARLYCHCELPYLFSPSDSMFGCHGMLGFLNDPRETADPLHDRLCEAGVLLYQKERLVCRLNAPMPSAPQVVEAAAKRYPNAHFEGDPAWRFPCTAVINVPDWMIPRMSKEDFVLERSAIWAEFIHKLENLLVKYLEVCRSEADLQAWSADRNTKFEAFLQAEYRRQMASRRKHQREREEERHPAEKRPAIIDDRSGWQREVSSNDEGAGTRSDSADEEL